MLGRIAKYTDEDILDAALELATEDGGHGATVTAIAKRLGAPSGSIYHRFASRDLLLATLWIRTVKRFQRGFLEALTHDDTGCAARQAVTHTLEWTATHESESEILALYRREDLITRWPDELGKELSSLNDQVKHAIRRFTHRHFGVVEPETLGKARFALIEIPYAAVRQTARGQQPPPWLAATVAAASLAALDSGSRDG